VTALHSGVNSLAFFCCAILTCPLLPAEELTQIPKFGIVLVLVVVLVLGALGFPDRRETDVLQLICSVSLIAKRDSRGRGTNSEGDQLGGTGQILPWHVFWTCHPGSRRSASLPRSMSGSRDVT
jgi:hypothetical protein